MQDWEGLLLLNSTAAWIWNHVGDAALEQRYADNFGIPLDQAKQDVTVAQSAWKSLNSSPPPVPAPPDLFGREHYLSSTYHLGEAVFHLRFFTVATAEELLPRLKALKISDNRIPDYTLDIAEEGETAFVFRGPHCIATEPLVTAARAILLQELTRLAVPERDFSAILHAGAIGTTESCLIIAGASFSGKSTLCAALMRSGLLCYSDDSACLTTDYQVAGMPFAISLREGSWPLFPELDKPRFVPSNLGSTSPTCTPNALVFVQYDAHTGETMLEPVETFDALVALHESGFWVEHSKAGIGRFVDWLSGLPIYRLRYSGLESAIAVVTKLLKPPQSM